MSGAVLHASHGPAGGLIQHCLKAAYLKRNNLDPMDSITAAPIMHDLNRILDLLHADAALRILPLHFSLPPLQKPTLKRECKVGELNQVWRYGGVLETPTDAEIEQKLESIQKWIAKELQ